MSVRGKKESNFELNLLPVISLLAVCISFLLLTTVWIHIGTVDIKQAIGEPQEQKATEEPPSMWVSIFSDKRIVVSFKGEGTSEKHKMVVKASGSDFNWSALNRITERAKTKFPKLTTALVLPDQSTKYKDIVKLVDELKKAQLPDVGVAPL